MTFNLHLYSLLVCGKCNISQCENMWAPSDWCGYWTTLNEAIKIATIRKMKRMISIFCQTNIDNKDDDYDEEKKISTRPLKREYWIYMLMIYLNRLSYSSTTIFHMDFYIQYFQYLSLFAHNRTWMLFHLPRLLWLTCQIDSSRWKCILIPDSY